MAQQINSIQQYVNSILSLVSATNKQEQDQYKKEIVETQRAMCIELWSMRSHSLHARMPRIKSPDEIDLQKVMRRNYRPSGWTHRYGPDSFETYDTIEDDREFDINERVLRNRLTRLGQRLLTFGDNPEFIQKISLSDIERKSYIEHILKTIESSISFMDSIEKKERDKTRNIEKVLQKKSTPISERPTFIKSGYTDDELRIIFKNLSELRYISPDSKEDDFVYYFSGNGNAPSSRIIWQGQEQKIFALFLEQMCTNCTRMPWKKLSSIFDGINTKSTRQNLYAQYGFDSMKKNKEVVLCRIFDGINIKS